MTLVDRVARELFRWWVPFLKWDGKKTKNEVRSIYRREARRIIKMCQEEKK